MRFSILLGLLLFGLLASCADACHKGGSSSASASMSSVSYTTTSYSSYGYNRGLFNRRARRMPVGPAYQPASTFYVAPAYVVPAAPAPAVYVPPPVRE